MALLADRINDLCMSGYGGGWNSSTPRPVDTMMELLLALLIQKETVSTEEVEGIVAQIERMKAMPELTNDGAQALMGEVMRQKLATAA